MEKPYFSLINIHEYHQKRRGGDHQPQRVYNEDLEQGRTFEALATNHYMQRRDQALTFEVSIKNILREQAASDLGYLSLTMVVLSKGHEFTNYTRTATVIRDQDPEAPWGSAIWNITGKSPINLQIQGSVHSGFLVFDDPDKELHELIATESLSLTHPR